MSIRSISLIVGKQLYTASVNRWCRWIDDRCALWHFAHDSACWQAFVNSDNLHKSPTETQETKKIDRFLSFYSVRVKQCETCVVAEEGGGGGGRGEGLARKKKCESCVVVPGLTCDPIIFRLLWRFIQGDVLRITPQEDNITSSVWFATIEFAKALGMFDLVTIMTDRTIPSATLTLLHNLVYMGAAELVAELVPLLNGFMKDGKHDAQTKGQLQAQAEKKQHAQATEKTRKQATAQATKGQATAQATATATKGQATAQATAQTTQKKKPRLLQDFSKGALVATLESIPSVLWILGEPGQAASGIYRKMLTLQTNEKSSSSNDVTKSTTTTTSASLLQEHRGAAACLCPGTLINELLLYATSGMDFSSGMDQKESDDDDKAKHSKQSVCCCRRPRTRNSESVCLVISRALQHGCQSVCRFLNDWVFVM